MTLPRHRCPAGDEADVHAGEENSTRPEVCIARGRRRICGMRPESARAAGRQRPGTAAKNAAIGAKRDGDLLAARAGWPTKIAAPRARRPPRRRSGMTPAAQLPPTRPEDEAQDEHGDEWGRWSRARQGQKACRLRAVLRRFGWTATPTPSAMMNGTVIGPVVTPPESNATARSLGTNMARTKTTM